MIENMGPQTGIIAKYLQLSHGFIVLLKNVFFSKASTLAVGPTQSPF
jgi:hypothetical protein